MKTIKDLLLAMLNATLILVALCLFLLWQVASSGERIAQSFANGLKDLSPIETKVDGLKSEVAGLRADLSTLSDSGSEASEQLRVKLQMRAANLNNTMIAIETELSSLPDAPERMAQAAIDHTADRASAGLTALLQCTAPSPES
ncbi:MAG: hypothetical protein ACU0A6_03815 [Shimia sp.]|jgi:hypothetical protein|uniref:hypothetical protein n=1 Tax=Shimia sp. TaxID=1954381 RepID=UPI004059FB90